MECKGVGFKELSAAASSALESGLSVYAISDGDRYAIVHVRISSPPDGSMKDVEAICRQRGREYRQEFARKWLVAMG